MDLKVTLDRFIMFESYILGTATKMRQKTRADIIIIEESIILEEPLHKLAYHGHVLLKFRMLTSINSCMDDQ